MKFTPCHFLFSQKFRYKRPLKAYSQYQSMNSFSQVSTRILKKSYWLRDMLYIFVIVLIFVFVSLISDFNGLAVILGTIENNYLCQFLEVFKVLQLGYDLWRHFENPLLEND